MPVSFDLTPNQRSNDQLRRTNRKQRKTFVYSKRNSDLNLEQMYESLDPNVAQLVQENRIKLVTMNSTRSKDLVNKTHNKLVAYLRSKPSRNTKFINTSTDRNFRLHNQNPIDSQKPIQNKFFDLTKLQSILKHHMEKKNIQKCRFNGVLAQKIIKLADKQLSNRPLTHRNINTATTENNQIKKNYLSWTAQKSKRRLKHMFI